jgi:hypothetical protein
MLWSGRIKFEVIGKESPPAGAAGAVGSTLGSLQGAVEAGR